MKNPRIFLLHAEPGKKPFFLLQNCVMLLHLLHKVCFPSICMDFCFNCHTTLINIKAFKLDGLSHSGLPICEICSALSEWNLLNGPKQNEKKVLKWKTNFCKMYGRKVHHALMGYQQAVKFMQVQSFIHVYLNVLPNYLKVSGYCPKGDNLVLNLLSYTVSL